MSTHERPLLSIGLSETEFRQWYWLKSELSDFCRIIGVPAIGSKDAIAACIADYLGGRQINQDGRISLPDQCPKNLTLATVVKPGFKLSKILRAFFVSHVGDSFCFNQSLRDFFCAPAERTLAEALAIYRDSLAKPSGEIGNQFEYNRHIREFFRDHPGVTALDAREAWWAKRYTRKLGD